MPNVTPHNERLISPTMRTGTISNWEHTLNFRWRWEKRWEKHPEMLTQRTCVEEGCTTILTRWNPGKLCFHHDELKDALAPPSYAQITHCCFCGEKLNRLYPSQKDRRRYCNAVCFRADRKRQMIARRSA
jgi:hypothetical protein